MHRCRPALAGRLPGKRTSSSLPFHMRYSIILQVAHGYAQTCRAMLFAPAMGHGLPKDAHMHTRVPQPINQTTPRRSSSNNAVGATSARAPPPPSTPRQRQQQQQQQRSPRTQHELQSAGTDPDGTLSKPGPFDANNSGEPEDANGPSSTEIPPPPTPPSPSNHARHATHPTPAGQSNSHTASHTTLSGQPVTHPSPAAPAAMHPALSRPHTSGPAFQGAGSSSAQHWEGGLNESPTYTGGPSATAPVARPHTSHSPSAFTLRMPGAGGPTGSVHPHRKRQEERLWLGHNGRRVKCWCAQSHSSHPNLNSSVSYNTMCPLIMEAQTLHVLPCS
eukprot:1158443-Pelagomonas_calceolata.AAC.27